MLLGLTFTTSAGLSAAHLPDVFSVIPFLIPFQTHSTPSGLSRPSPTVRHLLQFHAEKAAIWLFSVFSSSWETSYFGNPNCLNIP